MANNLSNLDANQVLRSAYDDSSNTLRTSIPALTTEIELDADDGDSVKTKALAIDNTVLLNAVDASSDQTSSSVNILEYRGFYVSIIASSLNAADSTIVIQASTDDTNWANVSGASVTLGSGNSVEAFNIVDAMYKYFRVVYTSNTVSTGTITVQYVVKG